MRSRGSWNRFGAPPAPSSSPASSGLSSTTKPCTTFSVSSLSPQHLGTWIHSCASSSSSTPGSLNTSLYIGFQRSLRWANLPTWAQSGFQPSPSPGLSLQASPCRPQHPSCLASSPEAVVHSPEGSADLHPHLDDLRNEVSLRVYLPDQQEILPGTRDELGKCQCILG